MNVSDGYVELTTPEAVAAARLAYADAWKDPSIPFQQRELADRELAAWKAGGECAPFDAFAWALEAIRDASGPPKTRESLIDIGAGSGYYLEVLQHVAGMSARYRYCGVDYSPGMIALARMRYPQATAGVTGAVALEFDVSDALALPCADRAFDVVVSGCYLVHISDWRAGVREAARVSRRWVVFHRTPLLYSGPTRYFTKRAYGVPCMEQHFGVNEFREALAAAGLSVRFERQIARTGAHANETWIAERVKA